MLEEIRADMPLNVVYAHERQPVRPGQGLRKRRPYEQSAYKSRTRGHGDRFEVSETDAGLLHGRVDDRYDIPDVMSAGQFGDHAAEERVQIDLG